MQRAPDRTFSRRDTVCLLSCLALSLLALLLPEPWTASVAASLRDSAFSPLAWLQARAEDGRTSTGRFRAVTTQRDSASFAAQFLPALAAENGQLRRLVGVGPRLETTYVPAEVLHQSVPTDGRMLLVRMAGPVRSFDPVISPDGLIGLVWTAGESQSSIMTWAHPEFRISATSADGRVFGIVAPALGPSGGETALEFRSTTYRDTLPPGTSIRSSGLGGVYPKGIPIGTVLGIAREQAGWERVYRLRPAASPAAVTHVLILTAPHPASVLAAFPGDSMLAALRADSSRRQRLADSVLRVRIADSVVRIMARDSATKRDTTARAAPPDTTGRR